MSHLLYKYKEGGYGNWVIVELGNHTQEDVASLLKAFFPSGRVLASLHSMTVHEIGVVTDPLVLCSPRRFSDPHTFEHLRRTSRELVASMLERWESHEHDQWRILAREIRARVLHLS